MAKPLQNITVAAPGFFGLNTQDSPLSSDASYASVADNCVIDKLGRIGARKGYKTVTTNGPAVLGTSRGIEVIFEFINRAGQTTVFTCGNNKIFTGTTTLAEVTLPVGYTISDNNWKVLSFNNDVYFFQSQHAPLQSVEGSSTLILVPSSGTNIPPKGNEVLAAFGRIWTCDVFDNKYTVYWSSLLAGDEWHGGSSGSVDLTSVWPTGYDEVVSLAEHNGFLIIFGKKSIIIYSGGESPSSNLTLADTIEGVGCVARDSVQSTGSDLFFLSSRGVMSLGRLLQQKSLPLNDVSKNIRSDLLQSLSIEVHANGRREAIKSIYSPTDAFYLLTFPDSALVYCFDLRAPLENGAYRVTTWSAIEPISFAIFADDQLYMGHDEGIVEYGTYLDGATKYQIRYFSNALDFGNSANLKFLKKFNLTIIGGQNAQAVLNWGYDYTSAFTKQSFTLTGSTNPGEYGVSEYNTNAEYTAAATVNTPRVNTAGSGEVVTIGVEAEINNSAFSIQKIDIHAILGRLI